MSRIVHISDLHFGRDIANRTKSMIQTINMIQADLIIISGDLTQRATRRQYQMVQRFLRQLSPSCLVIPGNHDLSIYHLVHRFFKPWKRWRKYVGSDPEPRYQTDQLAVACINTACPMGFRLDWSRGAVSENQIKKAMEYFEKRPKTALRIVVAHHPFRLPESEKHRRLTGGSDKALNAFKSADVDLILGGHIHTDYTCLENGMIISLAGSCVSDRLKPHQSNSFNLIQGDREKLTIEKIVWKTEGYRSLQIQRFKKTASGWVRV